MSDGEEEDFRPPRTPETWEALTDEEDRVEENTENNDSDLEGAEKIRFRRLIAWQQIARWSSSGKIGGKCSSFDSPGSHRSGKILDTFLQEIA